MSECLNPTIGTFEAFFLRLFMSLGLFSSILMASVALAIVFYKSMRLLLESLQELRGKIRARC